MEQPGRPGRESGRTQGDAAGAGRRVAELLTAAALFAEDRGKAVVGVAHFLDHWPSPVRWTLSSRTPRVRRAATATRSSAVPVDVVDTVGAGDAFVAGYLAERLAGGSPAARLALAVTTGAFVCLTSGDWEGLPRREELSLLTDREPVRR